MVAPHWEWIVFANVLLGVNQGLCWSSTVIMKIDLVGPMRRGLAMGLNEAAGYLAVAGAAFSSGYIASSRGLRPEPFYLGLFFAAAGLALSVFFVRDTNPHVRLETAGGSNAHGEIPSPSFSRVFRYTSWSDRRLFAACQAGFFNNLNDGMAWGLFPLFFAAGGMNLNQIAILAAVYPGVWGLAQLGAGAWSDRIGRKDLIVAGMWIQTVGIGSMLVVEGFTNWLAGAVVLGLGTALVYPTLLAAIGDVAQPQWRASAIGVYRLWRDSGYAVGAVVAGVTADMLGLRWAIGLVALLTFASGVVVLGAMTETLGTTQAVPPGVMAQRETGD